jgi:hypothetical protein
MKRLLWAVLLSVPLVASAQGKEKDKAEPKAQPGVSWSAPPARALLI